MYKLTQKFFKSTRTLGKTSIPLSKQGLGCMSMSEFYGSPIDEKMGVELIEMAFDNGINMFDTADVYGFGKNEILLGKAVSKLLSKGVDRGQIVVATKCGIIRDEQDPAKMEIDNSYAYIKQACDTSLMRLGHDVGHIDLFYIHRIANQGSQIDEAMRAMAELLEEGKIQAVGLSEASADIIQRSNAKLLEMTGGRHQLSAAQEEYSLMSRGIERSGVLDTCRALGITLVAYSPLSRALLTGEIETSDQFEESDFRQAMPRFQRENLVYNNELVSKVKEISEKMQKMERKSIRQLKFFWLGLCIRLVCSYSWDHQNIAFIG